MSRETDDLLPELEPPRGGVEKLRARLADGAPARRSRWLLPLALASAFACVTIAGFATGYLPLVKMHGKVHRDDKRIAKVSHRRHREPRPLQLQDDLSLVRTGVALAPKEPLTMFGDSAASLVMRTDHVDFYWVASVPSAN